jgi:hypothetical protein
MKKKLRKCDVECSRERKKTDKRFHANSIEKLKIENLATLLRLELLQKFPAKTEENSENP